MTRIVVSLMILAMISISAKAGEINKSFFGGVAIDGYDTTTYFDLGKAAEGDSDFVVKWKDAKWKFSTAEDAAKFKVNPEKYAPQYGGHCANAMSLNKKVEGDPEIWLIHNNKLFMFYAKSGLKRWQEGNIAKLAMVADNNWVKLKDK